MKPITHIRFTACALLLTLFVKANAQQLSLHADAVNATSVPDTFDVYHYHAPYLSADEDLVGITADRTYKKGIPDGQWTTYYGNGQTRYVITFNADKYLRIKQEMKKDRRQIFTPLALAGRNDQRVFRRVTFGDHKMLFHGLFVSYYEDGHTRDSGYYANGLRENEWVEKEDASGRWITGTYEHGRKTGYWRRFETDGTLADVLWFRKGKLVDQKRIKR